MSQQRVRFVPVVVSLLVALTFVFAGIGLAAKTTPTCSKSDRTLIKVGTNPAVCGKVAANPNVYTYQGIPYANPPTGALRWQPPQAKPWPPAPSDVVPRTSFGSKCAQPGIGVHAGDEDCLYLNVWTPNNAINPVNPAKTLPVMVFIHGGGFIFGSGSSPIFEGSALASSGVVVVTLNYRLGALGFLVANGHASGAIDGNFGLLDQQMAMRWVVNNIAAFGGDPTKITLFGESAGAISVGLHTFVVPSSEPLFAAAVMESNPLGVDYLDHAAALQAGNDFLDLLCTSYNKRTEWCRKYSKWCPKCPTERGDAQDAAWLAKLSTEEIIKIQNHSSKSSSIFSLSLPWAPVVDGTLVTAEPYAGYSSAVTTRKPLGLGVNANEGALFTAFDYHNDPGFFDATQFKAALAHQFTEATATQILGYDRYNPARQSDPTTGSYYNNVGVAFANLMTDYVFACGNLAAANAAAAGSAPVYGYQFTQPPFFDLYHLHWYFETDHGACMPDTGNVCHANELPYVFGNLGAVTTTAFTPTKGDRTLASNMAAAWAAFAIKPTAPRTGWLRYTSGGKLQQWNSASSQPVDLDTAANCSSLWLKTPPYKQ